MGTVQEDQYTFVIICCSVFLTIRGVSDWGVKKIEKLHKIKYLLFQRYDNHKA